MLVHAVDADGLEIKLEVPTDAARDLAEGHVLVFTWSAHAIPVLVAEAQAPTTTQVRSASQMPSLSTPRTADEQFLELTGRQQPAASSIATGAPAADARSTTDGLAELLGVRMTGDSCRA
ncbi:hypothetical protein [Nannocystis bainbridge]|uniref:Uncharacterized protein n=1 Tax=Nannocystis bainbridge TaxID=2995303 RepID=A0ABT5DUW8_9BACT|nr:hypothetical protein [Nannocystis bainbridge]MDC0716206.1 hypothetical protein [Nannocystis bainbridge]